MRPTAPVAGPELLDGTEVAGRAVLFRTGWDRFWGTDHYGDPSHPYLADATAERLVAGGAAVVGIDAVNIDGTADGARPIHTILLGAGVPIVEHLRGLDELIGAPFTFTAVPPARRGPRHLPGARLRRGRRGVTGRRPVTPSPSISRGRSGPGSSPSSTPRRSRRDELLLAVGLAHRPRRAPAAGRGRPNTRSTAVAVHFASPVARSVPSYTPSLSVDTFHTVPMSSRLTKKSLVNVPGRSVNTPSSEPPWLTFRARSPPMSAVISGAVSVGGWPARAAASRATASRRLGSSCGTRRRSARARRTTRRRSIPASRRYARGRRRRHAWPASSARPSRPPRCRRARSGRPATLWRRRTAR